MDTLLTDREAVARLTDQNLLDQARALNARSCALTAALLVHLGEVDARRLYADDGCSSMHVWCTTRLGMSDGAAFKRIRVARAGRELPALIGRLGSGALHLSGAVIIAPHLTEENHLALLDEISGKRKREVEVIAARLAPKPAVPSSIRRLPARKPAASGTGEPTEVSPGRAPEVSEPSSKATLGTESAVPLGEAADEPPGAPPEVLTLTPSPQPRDRLEPLSEAHFKVTLTAPAEGIAKLQEVQALMSHRHPGGEFWPVLDAALDLLREKLQKERFGAGAVPGGKPRPAKTKAEAPADKQAGGRRSRHIPMAVRAEVYRRDEGRCTFVDASGKRCGEKRFTELHHIHPFALGGEHQADLITVRCRAHNQLEARREFGAVRMNRAIE